MRSADQPTLTGSRVVLRPWRPGDAAAVYSACQDPEIQRWTTVPVPYTAEDATGFVTAVAADAWADGGALFAVVDPASDELFASVGAVSMSDGIAEIGYWTAAPARGRGHTSDAVRTLTAWLLASAGAHRVEAQVDPSNAASARVVSAAGFVREGILRQRYRHRGKVEDMVMWSRLATDGPAS